MVLFLENTRAVPRRLLNIPKSTVRLTLQQDDQRDNGKSLHRSGRPGACSERDKQKVISIIQKNPFITYSQLKVESGIPLKKSRHGLRKMEHPSGPPWLPYSPDLNPIKHAWAALKEKMYDINPNLENPKGGEEAVRKEILRALEQAWLSLDEGYIWGLIVLMNLHGNPDQ